MDNEELPLIIEICRIAKKRNDINTRRHRARFRKNYYSNAVAVIEAHNGSSAALRNLENHNANGRNQARIDSIKSHMAWLVKKHPKPTKWKAMGLHKLRSLVLQGQAEYAMAKHETMELSIAERTRVKDILAKLNGRIAYKNGSVVSIKVHSTFLGPKEIEQYAAQHEVNEAVETMLEK